MRKPALRPALRPAGGLYERLLELDGALSRAGFPKLSEFWRATLRRFLTSGRRRLVLRVGRRGGKSLTLCKLALLVALYGDWRVAPGELATVPFLSVDRTEASARLRTISRMLDCLAQPYKRRSDELELARRPVVFRVVTASLGAVVGFTSIACVLDEVARWRDVETGANPASEIVSSLAPTMATQPGAFLVLSSSPLATHDFHAQAFDRGDDEHQLVAYAPSWEANPTLTEAETHKLEPVLRVWLREYAAQPTDSLSSICSAEEYDAVVERGVREREPVEAGSYVHLVDPAFRFDHFVTMTVHRELRPRGDDVVDVIVVDRLTVLKPTLARRVSLDEGIGAVLGHMRAYPGTAFADIHYFDSLQRALSERGKKIVEVQNTPTLISTRVAALQSRFNQGTLRLVDDEEMRRQTLSAQLQLHAGGRMTLKAPERRGMHDDIVSCLLLACDPGIVCKMPFLEGDVVAVPEPVRFDASTGSISGGGARYFSRLPNGKLLPREPPYGTVMFDRFAEETLARGDSTASIERWKRERQPELERERVAQNFNIPIWR